MKVDRNWLRRGVLLRIGSIVGAIILVGVANFAFAQEQPKLGEAETAVKAHIGQVLKELPGYESYGRDVAERGIKDAKSGNIQGIEGPREHPWAKTGNPLSSLDWYLDSFYNLDATILNVLNWSQAWSCFEPKLLVKALDGQKIPADFPGPGNQDLEAECRSRCVNWPQHISPSPPFSIPAAIKYLALCPGEKNPHGYWTNGFEVAEYWFPENQVSINNYGINRIRPESISATGAKFTRTALIAQKTGIPESEIKRLIGESYPDMNLSDAKLLPNRSDPLIGQGVWGGYAAPDFEDKGYGHVVRTWLSVTAGSKRKKTKLGWQVEPDSLYDALPPPQTEKDAVNMWTEFGMWDVVTSVPHFSYKIRPDIMQAMYGPQKPYTETAKQEKPFWQSQGATAFRIARWPQYYKPLQETFKIQPKMDNALREAVYKGGYDLFPLVLNQSGFGSPALATGAIFARKALYIAGARSPAQKGGDASGELEKIFPQGAEKGRIATYTINILSKGQEIDKMQLIAPKRPKAGTRVGGIPPIVSECFRSQNIPNLVNMDQKLEKWVQGSLPYPIEQTPALAGAINGAPSVASAIRGNMPRTLNGYVTDTDTFSEQGGDITITYWNRRIGCFCDRCGLPTGSSISALNGDGDVLYDRPREALCRYPLFPQMTPWSAWHKEDTFEKCMANGQNEAFYDGTGLKDAT